MTAPTAAGPGSAPWDGLLSDPLTGPLPGAATSSGLPPWASWPLPGRSALAETVVDTLAAPGGAHPSAVVVTGTRGSGRSRLARRVVAQRDLDGLVTGWLTGTPLTRGVPFGSLRHLVARSTPASWLPELARQIVEDMLGIPRAGSQVPAPAQAPPVLVVDDLHLVDTETVDMLAEAVGSGRFRVLATWAVEAGRPDHLTTAVGADGVVVHPLPPVDDAAVALLLRRALDGDVEPQTVEALTRLSGGDPRRLAGIVTRALAHGSLVLADGVWTWSDGRAAARHTVDHPVVIPGERVQAVLDVVAVADGAVGPEVVVAAVAAAGTRRGPEPVTAEQATAALSEGEEMGLVRTVTSGHRRAVHLARRESGSDLVAGMGTLRRRGVALALADELDRFGGRRAPDVLRAVRWRLEATGTAPKEQLARACHVAARAGDVDSLEALTWAVLRDGSDPLAAARLADALLDHGRFAEATAVLDVRGPRSASRASARRTREDEAVATARAVVRARVEGGARQDPAGAVEVLLAALHAVQDGEARHRLTEALTWYELWRGGPEAALVLSADEERTGGPVPVTGARSLALALAGRSRSAADGIAGQESATTASGLAAIVAAYDDGWLDRAAALADETASDAAWSTAAEPRMWLAIAAGRVALRRGWAAAAARWYGEAAALAEACGVPGGARVAAAGLVVSGAWHPAARRGAPPLPSQRVSPEARAVPAADPVVIDERGGVLFHAEVVLAAAWQAARRGDVHRAHRWVGAGIDAAMRRGSLSEAAWLGYAYVRLGRPDLAAQTLEPLARRMEGSAVHAWADHAGAAVAGHAVALAEVGERLAVDGAWLDAATALAQAAQVVTDPARATAWRSQARDYISRCGAWQPST